MATSSALLPGSFISFASSKHPLACWRYWFSLLTGDIPSSNASAQWYRKVRLSLAMQYYGLPGVRLCDVGHTKEPACRLEVVGPPYIWWVWKNACDRPRPC